MSRVHAEYRDARFESVMHHTGSHATMRWGNPELVFRVELSSSLIDLDPLQLSIAITDLIDKFIKRIEEANGDVPTAIGHDEPEAQSLIL